MLKRIMGNTSRDFGTGMSQDFPGQSQQNTQFGDSEFFFEYLEVQKECEKLRNQLKVKNEELKKKEVQLAEKDQKV